MEAISLNNLVGGGTVTVTIPSGYSFYVLVYEFNCSGVNATLDLRFDADAGNHYGYRLDQVGGVPQAVGAVSTDRIKLYIGSGASGEAGSVGVLYIHGTVLNQFTPCTGHALGSSGAGVTNVQNGGWWQNLTSPTSFSILASANISGTVKLYGAK